jgi:hypothetical protein
MFYKNDSSSLKLFPLQVPGCGIPYCYLSKLEELSVPYIPLDWDEECRLAGHDDDDAVLPVMVEEPLKVSSEGTIIIIWTVMITAICYIRIKYYVMNLY